MARRRKKIEEAEALHDESERWLVSFADMMTLLFAVFMLLFSISSVNTSKFEALQKALQDAFSGRILSGGQAVMETGSSDTQSEHTAAEPPLASLQPLNAVAKLQSATPEQKAKQQAAAKAEDDELQAAQAADRRAREEGRGCRARST